MIRRNSEFEQLEFENVSMIENMAIGYDDDSFAIAINKKDDETYEGVYVISADKLKEIIMLLFETGVNYQAETGIDIGFGIGEENDV